MTVTAENGLETVEQTVIITVSDINEAPGFLQSMSDRNIEVAEGDSYTLTTDDLTASDEDTGDNASNLTWTVTTAPTGGQLRVGGRCDNG